MGQIARSTAQLHHGHSWRHIFLKGFSGGCNFGYTEVLTGKQELELRADVRVSALQLRHVLFGHCATVMRFLGIAASDGNVGALQHCNVMFRGCEG